MRYYDSMAARSSFVVNKKERVLNLGRVNCDQGVWVSPETKANAIQLKIRLVTYLH